MYMYMSRSVYVYVYECISVYEYASGCLYISRTQNPQGKEQMCVE